MVMSCNVCTRGPCIENHPLIPRGWRLHPYVYIYIPVTRAGTVCRMQFKLIPGATNRCAQCSAIFSLPLPPLARSLDFSCNFSKKYWTRRYRIFGPSALARGKLSGIVYAPMFYAYNPIFNKIKRIFFRVKEDLGYGGDIWTQASDVFRIFPKLRVQFVCSITIKRWTSVGQRHSIFPAESL